MGMCPAQRVFIRTNEQRDDSIPFHRRQRALIVFRPPFFSPSAVNSRAYDFLRSKTARPPPCLRFPLHRGSTEGSEPISESLIGSK